LNSGLWSQAVPLNFFQGFTQLVFGDIQHPNFQHFVGFGVVDQVMQAAPGTFQFLKIGMVYDEIQLFGDFLIQAGDNRLDRFYGIVGYFGNILQRILRQRCYCGIDLIGCLGAWFELLGQ